MAAGALAAYSTVLCPTPGSSSFIPSSKRGKRRTSRQAALPAALEAEPMAAETAVAAQHDAASPVLAAVSAVAHVAAVATKPDTSDTAVQTQQAAAHAAVQTQSDAADAAVQTQLAAADAAVQTQLAAADAAVQTQPDAAHAAVQTQPDAAEPAVQAGRKGASAGFGCGSVLAFGAVCLLAGILLGQSSMLASLAAPLQHTNHHDVPSWSLPSLPSFNLSAWELDSYTMWVEEGVTSVIVVASKIGPAQAVAVAAARGWGLLKQNIHAVPNSNVGYWLLEYLEDLQVLWVGNAAHPGTASWWGIWTNLFQTATLQHSSAGAHMRAEGCSYTAAYIPASFSNSSTVCAAATGTHVPSSCSPTAFLMQPAATCSPHVDVLACPHDSTAPFRRMLQQLAEIGLPAEEVSCRVDAGAALARLLEEVIAAGPSASQVTCSFNAGSALHDMLQRVATAEAAAMHMKLLNAQQAKSTAQSDAAHHTEGHEQHEHSQHEHSQQASSFADAARAVLRSPHGMPNHNRYGCQHREGLMAAGAELVLYQQLQRSKSVPATWPSATGWWGSLQSVVRSVGTADSRSSTIG